MKALARFCYDRRRYVLVAWIALLIGLFGLSSAAGGEFHTDFSLPGSESQQAYDLLEERGLTERTGNTGQVVFKAEQGVSDPEVRQAMESFFGSIDGAVEDVQIASPYDEGNAYQITADGKTAYAEVHFSERSEEQYRLDADVVKDLQQDIGIAGLQVELGGDIFAEWPDLNNEVIGLIAAVIILLIAFGSVLAMGLPLVTALIGIGCGVAIIGLATRFMAIPDLTMQVAMMIGIGVGIDYALLTVTRYRAALHDGLEPRDSVTKAIDTSGRAVVFAGITVVISLLGIFVMNMESMNGMAVGAVSAVLMTMLASITLLPALLGFVGHKIDRLGLPHRHSRAEGDVRRSFWYRWSRLIQARPWPALVAGVGLLVVLTIPLFTMQLGFGDAGNRLESDTTRRAYDLLSEGFGPGFNSPILVVADSPNGQGDAAGLDRLHSSLAGTQGVESVVGPTPVADGSLALFNVFPESAPQDSETTDLVHRLREHSIPGPVAGTDLSVMVSGMPAYVVDYSDYTADRLPLFFGAVLVVSFLVLMVVFHSVIVPLKAVIMNLLSIGAAFGAMVAVFQWGYLGSLFGLGREGPIEAYVPAMLFAIVFGLSMDYEVFLLSRVREEYDRTGDNSRAVADGIATTGRVITAAALIMVAVFGAFVLNDERAVKMMGFGLAFAIFIDATVVRMIVVPSAMQLMGKLNWWAPNWLAVRLPRIRVEAEEQPEPAPAPIVADG